MQKSKLQFKIQNFYFLVVVLGFSLLVFNLAPGRALAAGLELISQIREVGVEQQFQVDLMLDAEGQDINAAQGKIVFPSDLVELRSINDGNSIITFWVQKPTHIENSIIMFSGVIPGGFRGVLGPYWKGYKLGKIFSVVFTAKKEGSGAIEIRDAKSLLNDGQGTPAETRIFNFQFTIFKEAAALELQIPKDTDPPGLFTPEVASDRNIFDGKWFLVFAAQDKGSGVDYYAIHESARKKEAARINMKDWITAESPYVLKDQKLMSYVYVKAVDKAGNERFVVVAPRFAPWYKKPIVYIPLILGVFIGVIIIVRWLWRKYTKYHE